MAAPPEPSPSLLRSAPENCATAMAVVDRDLVLREANPSLLDWLGDGTRHWRGERLELLDATPPRLAAAAARALAEERRIWLRDARLRTAAGDRSADLALTPLDVGTLLVEVLPAAVAESSGLGLSESLRGFAHEVKGPLAGMRGAAQLLQRRVGAPDLIELATLIVAEVDRLATLADGLLDVGAKTRLASVNIHEVVERVAALVAASPGAVQVRRDYDPSLPPIAAAADRLQQACLNLARNAIEAGARTLTLRTRVEHGPRLARLSHTASAVDADPSVLTRAAPSAGPDGRPSTPSPILSPHCVSEPRLGTLATKPCEKGGLALRIDFADDGRGVPAELADTLFEPLVSGRADGTGLGLALVREVAREHGGDISYVSRPGATVFTLLLPLERES